MASPSHSYISIAIAFVDNESMEAQEIAANNLRQNLRTDFYLHTEEPRLGSTAISAPRSKQTIQKATCGMNQNHTSSPSRSKLTELSIFSRSFIAMCAWRSKQLKVKDQYTKSSSLCRNCTRAASSNSSTQASSPLISISIDSSSDPSASTSELSWYESLMSMSMS